ncbi:19788_t:CDS:2 [Dentiscutata erythropus]|uniref:19788_t:CDS:1 n=1 Tax=Dentiscutata erythropus TaxID=1348616 RepID=A0A9N9NR67_9GLOM|nr:19788_t:CDS:2 [Dentiscutata erythropus]
MHKAVINRLNSGLKLELTYWNETKQIKKLSPTYNNYTKTFTFQFDNPNYDISEPLKDNTISFIAFVKRSEDILFPTKLGVELGDLIFPEFLNNDLCKYEFDNLNNVYFKRETKEDEKEEEVSTLREGFRYADWVDWWDEYCKWWCEYFYNNFEYSTL